MDYSRYDDKLKKLINDCEEFSVEGDKRAPYHLRKLKRIAKENEDFALMGLAEFYFASWYYDCSQYEKFQSSLRHAIEALLRSDAYDLLARSYNFFAIDAQLNGAYDVAYSYYTSALQFADKAKGPDVSGIILHNLANFDFEVGNYKDARRHYRNSIRLIEKNKEDLFYYRNAFIAYINETANSMSMNDLDAAKKAFEKAKKIYNQLDETQYPDVMLSYYFVEVRLAFELKDTANIDELIEKLMGKINEESLSFLEMEDLKEFCMVLVRQNRTKDVERILALVTPYVEQFNTTYSLSSLASIKVEYYEKIKDEKKMVAALREQHSLILRQKKERENIYKYSIELIKLIGELQAEEDRVRIENEHLQIKALTDDLTGIPNRYSFDQSLSRAFERAFHSKNTLGVEIIDVDGFKEYNDNFGHQAGDECLEIIGEILKEFSEKEDIFCARYGGDEFVIIYEGKSDDEIKEIALQIGEAIRYPVTISQGVCNDIPVAKAKPWDFLSEADEALYSVKGKDGNDIPIRKLSKYR